jgi:hypothetical protein
MMDDVRPRDTGPLALAIAVAAAGSAASLATYFGVGGPFGTISDFGNAATGILSGCLAWRLRGLVTGRARAAVGLALAGAAVTVAGTALVVSGTTTYLLAGLVSSLGFAGIGAWVVTLNRGTAASAVWPPRLRALGVAAGSLMAIGVVVTPGIALRFDDMATMPAWVWVGFLGWLGIFIVYPAWALWLGVVENRYGRVILAAGNAAVTD